MRTGWFPLIAAPLAAVLYVAAAQAETVTVVIEKMEFTPAEISVKAGDTVEWINKDILDHTATVKGGWEVVIPARKKASTVLSEPGPVEYYCRFHPNMKGGVQVLPGG